MAIAGSRRLKSAHALRAALVATLLPLAAHAQSMHFDGVEGNPAWAPRLEAAIRDSLTRRGADLWSADSLAWLKERNEWAGDDRTPAQVSKLAKRTKRTSVAWVKSTPPNGRFDRPLWTLLWTRRIWTVDADIFVADATGKPKASHVSVLQKKWLGFTGTTSGDLWPVSDQERSQAENALLAELASKITQSLATPPGKAAE